MQPGALKCVVIALSRTSTPEFSLCRKVALGQAEMGGKEEEANPEQVGEQKMDDLNPQGCKQQQIDGAHQILREQKRQHAER